MELAYSEGKRIQLERLFQLCDKNGDGTIDKEELGSVDLLNNCKEIMLVELGVHVDPNILFAQLDENKNGAINFEEFYIGFGKFLSPSHERNPDLPNVELTTEQLSKLKEIFIFMDKDSSGKIDRSELSGICLTFVILQGL